MLLGPCISGENGQINTGPAGRARSCGLRAGRGKTAPPMIVLRTTIG